MADKKGIKLVEDLLKIEDDIEFFKAVHKSLKKPNHGLHNADVETGNRLKDRAVQIRKEKGDVALGIKEYVNAGVNFDGKKRIAEVHFFIKVEVRSPDPGDAVVEAIRNFTTDNAIVTKIIFPKENINGREKKKQS